MTGSRSFARIAGALLLAAAARGAVTPNSLFTDNCVLQRDRPVPVWGKAPDGARITVEFAGQRAAATAAHGQWKVWLKAMPADATPRDLIIREGAVLTLRNVVVGDVWVASGQSNMERQLGPRPPQPDIVGWREAAAAADYPAIRQYKVPEHAAPTPTDDAGGAWTVCSPRTAPEFSAVGFFFARAIRRAEKVPVGLLFTAWGGTMAQAWTSAPALATMDDFSTAGGAAKAMIGNPDFDKTLAGVLYNGMIAPLQSFPIRGVIWYQGESDCDHGRQYRELFPLLIADWRRGWGQGDFPFLYVQIAPSKFWTPEIREAQLLTLGRSRNTAMVETGDIGDPQDMHPARKAPVGERLALAARALAYREPIEYSGPLFASLTVAGGRATLRFTHAAGGLTAPPGGPRGFEVTGADGKFVPAGAEVRGETVVVSADGVGSPVAVRYGWARAPDVDLFNRAGLPASPFRTEVDPDYPAPHPSGRPGDPPQAP